MLTKYGSKQNDRLNAFLMQGRNPPQGNGLQSTSGALCAGRCGGRAVYVSRGVKDSLGIKTPLTLLANQGRGKMTAFLTRAGRSKHNTCSVVNI